MKNLKTLRPLKVRIILDEKFLKKREALKLTLQDLIIRGLLKLSDKDEKIYIELGPGAKKYRSRVHEEVFFEVFKDDFEMLYPIKSYVRAVVERAKRERWKVSEVCQAQLKGYIKQSFWQGLWGNMSLTDKGRLLQADLRREVVELQQFIETHRVNNPEAIEELRKSIGANIRLAEGIQADHHTETVTYDSGYDSDTLSPFIWYVGMGEFFWNDFLDSEFDVGYGSEDGWSIGSGGGCSGDSDSGGDSGCSGCGGGCSGCGGD